MSATSGRFVRSMGAWVAPRQSATAAVILMGLAWAPFPMGSAVTWGAAVMTLFVCAALMVWALSVSRPATEISAAVRLIWFPVLLAGAALMWGLLQIVPLPSFVPINPIWKFAGAALGHPPGGVVSVNPWRTGVEVMKLASAGMMFLLTFQIGRSSRVAYIIFDGFVALCAIYALYGFVLAGLDLSQAQLIYGLPFPNPYMSGPFMLHNSFATFLGMGAVTAGVRLMGMARAEIVADRGRRLWLLSVMNFILGRRAPLLFALLIIVGALLASASRAGFVSSVAAFGVVGAVSLFRRNSDRVRLRSVAGVAVPLVILVLVLIAGAGTLSSRLAQLVDAGAADDVRVALWGSAQRMIAAAPWTGLGLGTFEDAYPMFAQSVLPFVMDKAHCDYLEFAAGLGLPAAVAWWSAIVFLGFLCLYGALSRRRDGGFALSGVGLLTLVGLHSTVDFSLQIPAVSLSFAALLGVAVAQSFRREQTAMYSDLAMQSPVGEGA